MSETRPAGTPYRLAHHQAIWETARFVAYVPPEIPVDQHEEWLTEHFDELLCRAMDEEDCVVQGDAVEGVDSELEIHPATESDL